MATNFVQGTETTVTVAAPSGGVSAGKLVVVRGLVGVAHSHATSGAACEIATKGGPVYTVPADTNLQIDVGDRVFYDTVNFWVDKTTTAQSCVGVAVPLDTLSDVAKATAGTTVRVLLGGGTPTGT